MNYSHYLTLVKIDLLKFGKMHPLEEEWAHGQSPLGYWVHFLVVVINYDQKITVSVSF